MFNGYVNIDKKYILNDDVKNAECENCFSTINNLIDVESHINYLGPCCVYLEREIESDYEQSCLMLIGNNDAYKFWLNDELIGYGFEPLYWGLQNMTVMLHLKKGKNKIVFKLIRRNAPFKFSAMLSAYEFGNGVHIDINN